MEGQWVGYDTESKASQIYWPDKHMMSVEHNIKFNDDFVLLPETAPVKGEWVDVEPSTLSLMMVTSSSGDMTPHTTPPTAPPAADSLKGLKKGKLPEGKRSAHTKKPSAYV